jgi:ABC-type uncharacterized transport system involved in gliding motility auxiliary subunit
MNSEWLKARQTRYGAYLVTYLVVIIAILGATNWLANRHNKAYDSTANKRYSLSQETEKVVKGLNRDVTITYFDKTSEFGRARDLLDRYNNLSTRLKVDYVDPDKKPQLAKAAGVRTYGTIYVDSGLRKEEAKSLTEEDVTGALIRSLKSGERNVCFVSGSGEHGLDDSGRTGYSAVKDSLEKNNYKTRTISLLQAGSGAATTPQAVKLGQQAAPAAENAPKPSVPADCTVLVVAGPKYDYTQPEVDAIKTYVENGGRALLMIDPPLKLGHDDYSGSPALSAVIESWGVTLDKDLALDTSGVGQIFGLGPEVPLVTSYESQPIVRDLKDVATAFPLARTLDVKSPATGTAEALFSTSSNSYATTQINSPEIRIDPKKDKKGPLTLAAAGTYKGAAGKEGRFVVVGSSNWASNNILPFNGNRDLFLNMMNWLSSDEDLISIRPKDPEDRRLNISSRQMSALFYSSMLFLPLIVVVSGFVVWWQRR